MYIVEYNENFMFTGNKQWGRDNHANSESLATSNENNGKLIFEIYVCALMVYTFAGIVKWDYDAEVTSSNISSDNYGKLSLCMHVSQKRICC